MAFLILIGMSGTGKSVLGREIARLTSRTFLDTDSHIEKKYNLWVSQIFEKYGEEEFRKQETELLKSLEPEHGVLITGGGTILLKENREEFTRLGTTIFLEVPPERLKKRLRSSKRIRPLLNVENWEIEFDRMYTSRYKTYREADYSIKLPDDNIKSCAKYIVEQLKREGVEL